MDLVLNELLLLHGLLPGVGHPESVVGVDLEVAVVIDSVVKGDILMAEVLLWPSDSPVDDDEDEKEDEDEQNAADEGNEPGLSGELLHAETVPVVGEDDVDDVVRIHLEHEGCREWSMALLGECCSSDDVGLVESEVGQSDGGGGGVEEEVGVNDGAVGLDLDIVPEQLSVPVLRRRRGQRHRGAGAVQHLHHHVVRGGGGDVLQGLHVHGV